MLVADNNQEKAFDVIQRAGLTTKSRLVYLAIIELQERGYTSIDNPTLEEMTRLKEKALWSAKNELADKGLITFKRSFQKGTIYTVLKP